MRSIIILMKIKMKMEIQMITNSEERHFLQNVIDAAVNKAVSNALLNTASPKEQIEVIDTKTLCLRLGITQPTVIRWRKKKRIPFLLVGSSVRFNYSAVVAALEVTDKKRGN